MSQDKSDLFLHYWRILAPAAPVPVAEYPFDRDLGRKHRADWCFPDRFVIVEIDGGGYAFRGGRHATDADREKCNIAASLGYRVFRFSPKQMTSDPAACVELVRKAVER